MPVCKLCRNEVTALINAHVIPKSLWEIDGDQPPPRLVTNTADTFPKRVPIGVYDQTIVCETCERRFSPYDTYAADFLLNRTNKFEQVRDEIGKLGGYLVHNYDYRLLKLFGISVLWRAAVSSHPLFSRVQLGPFEEKARDMLVKGEPGDAMVFGVLFSVWDGGDSHTIMDPFAGRLSGVRTYRFYLGRFVAHIKVDRRPFPSPLAEAILSAEGRPLHIVSRDLAASKEYHVMGRVIEANTRFLGQSNAGAVAYLKGQPTRRSRQ